MCEFWIPFDHENLRSSLGQVIGNGLKIWIPSTKNIKTLTIECLGTFLSHFLIENLMIANARKCHSVAFNVR